MRRNHVLVVFKCSAEAIAAKLVHRLTKLVHRLLFRALLEIRSEGHTEQNKAVFHLADLFHTIVLEMENAAEGRCTYDEVLNLLEERTKEKGLDRLLNQSLSELKP